MSLINSYRNNRSWAEQYTDQVVEILRRNLLHLVAIELADDESDMRRATDMMVCVVGGSVCVRIRRPGYYDRFRDWTIRAVLPSGVPTEIDKLRAGYGDWYLYCWTGLDGRIVDWWLINLEVVRCSGLLLIPRPITFNRDGIGFISISREELVQAGALVDVGDRGTLDT